VTLVGGTDLQLTVSQTWHL